MDMGGVDQSISVDIHMKDGFVYSGAKVSRDCMEVQGVFIFAYDNRAIIIPYEQIHRIEMYDAKQETSDA
jgi:hypothetical protein